MLSRNIIDNSRSAKDTTWVIVSDTTTWSITYDCHSKRCHFTIVMLLEYRADHKYQYFDLSTKRASLLQQSKKLYIACPWHFLASFCFLRIKKSFDHKIDSEFFFFWNFRNFFSLFISKIDPLTLPIGLYCLPRGQCYKTIFVCDLRIFVIS